MSAPIAPIRHRWARPGLILLAATLPAHMSSAQAKPAASPAALTVPNNRGYSLVPPKGWRQVPPGLAREMLGKMPADLKYLLVLNQVDRFGAVDAWLESGFDGRCLTLHTEGGGEPAMTAATLSQIQAKFLEEDKKSALRYEVEAELGSIGAADHPAIVCQLRIFDRSGEPLSRSLEFIVPTGGQTLRFSFRADATDFAAAEPVFRAIAASVSLSAPPEGKKELSDKLVTPLIIGALVGLLMLALYKLNRG